MSFIYRCRELCTPGKKKLHCNSLMTLLNVCLRGFYSRDIVHTNMCNVRRMWTARSVYASAFCTRFMKLAAECFMEARQIFMNNSKSSVLKCKVCSEWGWRPRCFLSELGRSLSFQRLVGPWLFLRSPESPSFPEKARPMEHTPRSTQGLAHRKAS